MDCSIHALNRAACPPPLKSQSEVPSPVAPLGCGPTALAAAKIVIKAPQSYVSPCCGTLAWGVCILVSHWAGSRSARVVSGTSSRASSLSLLPAEGGEGKEKILAEIVSKGGVDVRER